MSSNKHKQLKANVQKTLIYISAGITFAMLIIILGYIMIKGVPHLNAGLFSINYTSENASMLPSLINTIVITLIALVIAIPLGVGAAIFLVEYASKGNKLVSIIRMTTETLSGIPSIVYGLFGMLFLVIPNYQELLHYQLWYYQLL